MRIQEFRKFKIFFPVEEEDKKNEVKKIPQPIVEEVEDEELVNPDDGEGEG
jgi:hypothetical protein